MTVRELIARLSTLPQDSLVIMSRDAEGNGYSPLANVDPARYRAYNTWSGEISDEDSDEEDDEEYGVPCVALWPVN